VLSSLSFSGSFPSNVRAQEGFKVKVFVSVWCDVCFTSHQVLVQNVDLFMFVKLPVIHISFDELFKFISLELVNITYKFLREIDGCC
jgi:hypothetical protein